MKKLMSAGLAVLMAVSLVACSSSSSSSSETAAATTSAAAETEAEAEAADETEAAAEAASSDETFKIGVIGPYTGATSAYGLAVRNAAEMAINEVNAAGGANGYMLEMNAQDDEHDAQKSVNAYNALKDWGVQMIVGSVTSAPCIAVAAETEVDNMFQITPSGSAVDCVAPDNVFRICFSDPDQGKAAAQYVGNNGLATKVAIIYDSSTEYSSGIREAFIGEAANQGLEIVADEAFTADNATDFSVQLDKAKDADAELVFLPIYYQEASIILKQASDKEYSPIFFGVDGMDGILTVENFDTSLAEGVMLLTPFSATEEGSLEFTSNYEAEYGIEPNQFAADAYDAIYAIKAAIEYAGITPDMSYSDICDAMKDAMVNISIDGLTGAGMTWNAGGEPDKEPKAAMIVDGEYVMQ